MGKRLLSLFVMIALTIALPLSLAGLPNNAFAADDQQAASSVPASGSSIASSVDHESKTIKVGYIDYAGFIEKGENGAFTGYGVDFLNLIAQKTGWSVEYVHYKWSDLVGTVDENGVRNNSAILNGDVDFVLQAQKTPERERDFSFADYPTGYESTVVYALPTNEDIYYDDIQGMQGKRVALLQESYQTEEFLNFAQGTFDFTPLYYPDDAAMLDALHNGSVDMMVTGSLSGFHDLKVVEKIGAAPYFCMTSPSNTQLLRELNTALGDLMANNPGFTSTLYETYYGQAASNSSPLFTREEIEFIKNAPTFTVGQHANRKPISGMNDTSTDMVGINEDILNKISELSGLKFKNEPLPVGVKPLEALRNQDFDLVCGITDTSTFRNDSTLLLSDSFLTSNIVPVVQRNVAFDPNANLNIAIPSSFQALEEFIHQSYPNFNIVYCSTNYDCLLSVADGKADAAMVNEYLLNYLMQSPRLSDLETVRSYFFDEASIFAGLSENTDPLLMSVINKSIACIPASTLNQIVVSESAANYYEYTTDDFFYKFGMQIIVLLVVLLVIAALVALFIATRNKMIFQLEEKNEQLAETSALAQTASTAKSDFLAQMSHEIRTPMNAIIGMTSIAKTEVNDPTKTLEDLGKIEASSQMLLTLINDILDMTAIENKKMKIAADDFNFKKVLSSVSTVFYAQGKQRDIEFSVHMKGDLDEELVGDQMRVNQILLNLLSNAMKFTNPGGHVSLGIECMKRTDAQVFIRFTVADDGVGMNEDMLERLFSPFEQESATTARKHGGSGLGLSITKNLVDLMHGSISVESKKGIGTTFTVDIPFGVSNEIPSIVPPEEIKKLRTIVVDDDQSALDYMALVLDRLGVSHDQALDGETALDMLGEAEDQDKPYDVCFIDWKMPGMDGLEVTRTIREVFGDDSVIIIISALDLNEIEGAGAKAGANYFIPKPLFQSTVFDVLERACKGDYALETAEPTDYDFKGKTVMVAEDVAMNLEVAVRLLQMVGITVKRAEDGAQAVQVFERSEPGSIDCILMDVNMPEMNGYEATRAIRNLDREDALTVPIYAMTANAFTEDVADALNAGMNGHLAKPIDTDLLYKTLSEVFTGDSN